MPGERAPTTTRGSVFRHLAPAVAVLALATAACGSGTGGTSGAGSATDTSPLAPWQGAFTTVAVPTGVQGLRAVACPSAARCWAVGSTAGTAALPSTAAIVASADGGVSWGVQHLPATVGYLAGISCPTARACVSVGQMGTAGVGAVVSTVNGGSTWALGTVPAGTSDVTAVTCLRAGSCTALADVAGRVTALTAPGVGGPWVTGGPLPATVSTATAVSCTDSVDCWATGVSPVAVGHTAGVVASTSDGGVTWTLDPVPAGAGALQGIACSPAPSGRSAPDGSSAPTTSSTGPVPATGVACTAVGTTTAGLVGGRTGAGVVLVSTTGGASWATAPVQGSTADLLGVSCGAGPCVAVGTTTSAVPDAGVVVLTTTRVAGQGGWRRALVAPVAFPLAAVACSSLAACVVVGESIGARLAAG